MKHPTFYASLLLLAVSAMPAMGRTTITVSGSGTDDAVFDVTDGLVIDFASKAGSMVVKESSSKESTFAITDATVLTFKAVSGVSDIAATNSAIALRRNPVENALEFTAAPESACTLHVYSLQGAALLTVPGWQGESVDVSDLTPGLYIVNINNQSIKFYKK
ncbi:MAG: T9SS type A sorting domain-containing protein [Muribaculaceae bacterium]|nr:T9SS type A sorting domain-containing protein [Muribaculaceae bacterium]